MTDDELKALFGALWQESVEEHAKTRRATDRFADNRHFFEAATEGLLHEIRLVAEGVTDMREMLGREADDIRQELRRTAAETQAMFKFSHA